MMARLSMILFYTFVVATTVALVLMKQYAGAFLTAYMTYMIMSDRRDEA